MQAPWFISAVCPWIGPHLSFFCLYQSRFLFLSVVWFQISAASILKELLVGNLPTRPPSIVVYIIPLPRYSVAKSMLRHYVLDSPVNAAFLYTNLCSLLGHQIGCSCILSVSGLRTLLGYISLDLAAMSSRQTCFLIQSIGNMFKN